MSVVVVEFVRIITPSVWGTAVYIKKVTLKDVCCFEDLTLEFNLPKASGHWAVLLGDNSTGKTTVLRSIAMGLCGETSASALLRELYTDWVRYQAVNKTARIRIEFAALDRPEPVWIETKITESSSGDTEVHQITSPKQDFPWEAIFVCAYGAKRGGYASQDITEYSSVDSVYTLFNYDALLQNPELILRRFEDKKTAEQIIKTIDSIERYSHLKSQPSLTTEEQQELNRLHARLVQDLGSGETELQRLVERAVHETIDKIPQPLTSPKPAPEAIDFEIRRQLKELFSEHRDS